jgi:hypothetical protein
MWPSGRATLFGSADRYHRHAGTVVKAAPFPWLAVVVSPARRFREGVFVRFGPKVSAGHLRDTHVYICDGAWIASERGDKRSLVRPVDGQSVTQQPV